MGDERVNEICDRDLFLHGGGCGVVLPTCTVPPGVAPVGVDATGAWRSWNLLLAARPGNARTFKVREVWRICCGGPCGSIADVAVSPMLHWFA
mgnify:CR=1 FL=1